MKHRPAEPTSRHVWVRLRGDHSDLLSGVVVSWQHNPVRSGTASGRVALVVTAPFGGALLLEWIEAERLVPVLDGRRSFDVAP